MVEAGADLQALVEANEQGTTFYLREGTYRSTDSEAHVIPKEGQSFIGAPGAVMDGQGVTEYAFLDIDDPTPDVTIQGLVIENYPSPVQRAAIDGGSPGWRVLDNEIRHNGAAAINLRADDLVIERNFVHHNEQIGIKVQDSTGSRIVGNEIAHNNPNDEFDPSWEAGGTKFLRSTDLYIAENFVHNNHGPGLWTDHNNFEIVYERNTVVDNTGPGIFHEISGSAVIRDNIVTGNAHGFYVGGILVANSSDVTVSGNELADNGGGIIGIQDDRDEFVTLNLTVRENTIQYSQGISGIILNGGRDVTQSGSIRFFDNAYQTTQRRPFRWGRTNMTVLEWQALGQDSESTFDE